MTATLSFGVLGTMYDKYMLMIIQNGSIVTPLILMIIFLYFTRQWVAAKRPSGFPPGPPWVPLVGSAPFLEYSHTELYKEFSRLAKKYGNIFSVALGQEWVVVLNDYESIREAFVCKGVEFAGRPSLMKQDLVHKYYSAYGIIDGDYSPEWSRQRHNALSILHRFGWGHRHSVESCLLEEREAILTRLKFTRAMPFDPALCFNTCGANIICSLLFSRRFSHHDDKLLKLMHNLNEALSIFLGKAEWAGVPLLSGLLSYMSLHHKTLRKLSSAVKGVHKFVATEIRDRRRLVKAGLVREPRDFIEHYLMELYGGTAHKAEITEDWLHDVAVDFFVSGSETTATTLRWALLYLLRYTHVMDKVRNELDKVLGEPTSKGVSTMKHKAKLPYTEATIMEIQRLASILPAALFHGTLTDVSIKGYRIPKGTQVRANLHAVLHDPTYWPQPELLRPERFLGSDGQVVKDARWIPFGLGRRMCMGEELAQQQLFLFLTGILHSFNLRLPDGDTLPSLDPASWGAIVSPQNFKIIFEPRFSER